MDSSKRISRHFLRNLKKRLIYQISIELFKNIDIRVKIKLVHGHENKNLPSE